MKYQRPKGTIDLIGKDFYTYKWVQDTILRTIENYGFIQARTPMFESLDLLAKDSGDEVFGQIYKFKDKSGREFGLKSDITPAVSRIIAEQGKSWIRPVKLCILDRVYRYERPQKRRLREITQINAEMFGVDNAQSDAEILSCMIDCYKDIGFEDIKIILGYRPWLTEFLKITKIKDEKSKKVIQIIDKIDKLSEEDYLRALKLQNLNKKQINAILELKNLNGDPKSVITLAETIGNAKMRTYISRIKEVISYMSKYQADKSIKMNLGLARGSEYYTGIIFEARIEGIRSVSIGGGGRYDELISKFANWDIEAVGFSIGVDRVVEILKESSKLPALSNELDYYIVTDDWEKTSGKVLGAVQDLRRKNYKVEYDLKSRYISEQMKIAKQKKAKQIIVIDSKDLTKFSELAKQ